jgi:NAD(P)-dependent dehydrogenase (short-subunit alcohol dehydrogenase family)
MNKLTEKTILVTGASSGIGAAVVRQCVQAGAIVIAADRDDPATHTGLDLPHQNLTLDVSDGAAVQAAIAGLKHLDGVVNAAGIVGQGSLQQIDQQKWQHVMDVNVTGTMLVCKYASEVMLATNTQGSIVNLCSAYGLTGGPGNIAYNVSKSAIWQLTRCAAADLGASGIRVNAVGPGYIETPMTDMLKNAGAFRDQFVAMHLLKRPGQAEEVATAICFLLSDDASYITGATLPVDGGFTAAHVPMVNLG